MKKAGLVIGGLVVVLVIALVAYFSFGTSAVSSIKMEDQIGETVRVRGEVTNVVKIGSLSGYTLEDTTGTIAVSSEDLPKEGTTVRVKGTLIRDTLFGYYIKVD